MGAAVSVLLALIARIDFLSIKIKTFWLKYAASMSDSKLISDSGVYNMPVKTLGQRFNARLGSVEG